MLCSYVCWLHHPQWLRMPRGKGGWSCICRPAKHALKEVDCCHQQQGLWRKVHVTILYCMDRILSHCRDQKVVRGIQAFWLHLIGAWFLPTLVIVPFIFAWRVEKSTPPLQWYIIKANIFMGIVGYIGIHFNTHYFYNVLGVRYTGPLAPRRGWNINRVPVLDTRLLHDVSCSFLSTSPSSKILF